MIDIGDGLEVFIVKHVGVAQRRPDVVQVAGIKIWPDGKVGRWHGDPGFRFAEGRIEFRDGETLWDLIARAVGEMKHDQRG
jgi:hypothetical protein